MNQSSMQGLASRSEQNDTTTAMGAKASSSIVRGHNLPSNDGSAPRGQAVLNRKNLLVKKRVEPAFPGGEYVSRAEPGLVGGIIADRTAPLRKAIPNDPPRSRGMAPDLSSNSTVETRAIRLASGDKRSAGDARSTRARAQFCGTSAKGSVTRLERFGASPKAMLPLGCMADFKEIL